MDTDQLFRALDAKRRELGMTHAELGIRAFGKSNDTSLQNMRRGSMPSFERMRALADALSLEFYFGPKRAGDGRNPEQLNWKGFAEDQLKIEGRVEALGMGYEPIFYLAEAGGVENLSPFALSRAYLKDAGLQPDALRCAKLLNGQGNGYYDAGDVIVIDTAHKADFRGDVFAFFASMMSGIEVARLSMIRGGLTGVRSGQGGPQHFDLERGHKIVGRVVYSFSQANLPNE